MGATEAHAPGMDALATPESDSRRLADARERAERRLRRQRDQLRPLGWAMIAVVVAGAAGGRPQPGLHGRGLGVTLSLCTYAASIALAIRPGFTRRPIAAQAALIAAGGAAAVALVTLQSQGASEIAAGAAVWMAVARLPLPIASALTVATAACLAAAAAAAGAAPGAIAAALVVLALLALVAHFIKQARASQDRAEMLLAELEDARDEQARVAVVAERARIAGELHDVLAHSLSGAAIQLQAARKIAERESAGAAVRDAVDRAGRLVRDGLASSRQAVGALRGEGPPGADEILSLVARFRDDIGAEVAFRVDGTPRTLRAEAGLALYRGAQEALTNVARYAPGAVTDVVLCYDERGATLTVEDRLVAASPGAPGTGLAGVGGGHGLDGLRDRVGRIGGSVDAGPTADGWRVAVRVTA